MQTLGERLEEARKRLGISIRDAAEATKIRGDFLISFENNSIEIPLPEVYVRGFLKSYARFLKMDEEKVVTDFEAMRLSQGEGSPVRHGDDHRELIGQLSVSDPDGRPGVGAGEHPHPDDTDVAAGSGFDRSTLYYKVGLAAASLVFLICLVTLLVHVFSGDPDTSGGDPNAAVVSGSTGGNAPGTEEEITLIATGDLVLTVTETKDNRQIYSGALSDGESLPLKKEGEVRVTFSEGKFLVVKKGDQHFRPNREGYGRTFIP